MNKKFQLNKEYNMQIEPAVPAVYETFSTLTRTVEDNGYEVNANVYFTKLPPIYMQLWNENTIPTYDSVGLWDDDMVNNRILELLELNTNQSHA
jgi:hypothetical protein